MAPAPVTYVARAVCDIAPAPAVRTSASLSPTGTRSALRTEAVALGPTLHARLGVYRADRRRQGHDVGDGHAHG